MKLSFPKVIFLMLKLSKDSLYSASESYYSPVDNSRSRSRGWYILRLFHIIDHEQTEYDHIFIKPKGKRWIIRSVCLLLNIEKNIKTLKGRLRKAWIRNVACAPIFFRKRMKKYLGLHCKWPFVNKFTYSLDYYQIHFDLGSQNKCWIIFKTLTFNLSNFILYEACKIVFFSKVLVVFIFLFGTLVLPNGFLIRKITTKFPHLIVMYRKYVYKSILKPTRYCLICFDILVIVGCILTLKRAYITFRMCILRCHTNFWSNCSYVWYACYCYHETQLKVIQNLFNSLESSS